MKYVVSDIHGEITKLKKLMNLIISLDNQSSFVFIGDYIDKGEDPKSTLDFLTYLSINFRCVFLIGNHEYIWVNLKENDKNSNDYLYKYGGLKTAKSFSENNLYATKKIMIENFNFFFNSLVPYWENEKYIVTHSGIEPGYMNDNLKKIPIEKLLFNRYNFIKQEKLFKNKKIIFGHTGFYTPYVDSYKIGIDTAACFLEEQPITAFCLEKEFFIDSNNNTYYLESIKLDRCPSIIRVEPWRI